MSNRILYNFILSIFCMTAFLPQDALAYVGPGTGVSAIGVFLALIVGSIAAIIGFIWYPIKRLLGKKNRQEPDRIENEGE